MKTKCMSCGGSMKKMAAGGTTTKRIIKKSTGGMYGIPQENLGTSGQYGFAQKGGVIKAIKKVVKKITRPTTPKMKLGGSLETFRDGGKTYDPISKKWTGTFTPNGRLKSKKTRHSDIGNLGSSVSRTKRNGDVVTKSITTSEEFPDSGLVQRASKTKTITDKEGAIKSKKTKGIGWNSALRKIYRVDKNVGRNENDTYRYKKGGATKATKFAALAPPYNKATFADRIVGAKKSAGSKKLPKAQLGAIIKGIMGFKTAYKASKIVKQAAKKGNFKDWHNEMDILLKKSNPNIKKYIDKETVIKNFKKVIKSKPGDTYKSAVNLKSISPKPKNTYKSAVNLKNTSKVKVNAKNKK